MKEKTSTRPILVLFSPNLLLNDRILPLIGGAQGPLALIDTGLRSQSL